MHAAGSSCSYWLPVVAKISPEQYCEALRVDYAVALARTVAGKCTLQCFFGVLVLVLVGVVYPIWRTVKNKK
jgi:hypothetical protein